MTGLYWANSSSLRQSQCQLPFPNLDSHDLQRLQCFMSANRESQWSPSVVGYWFWGWLWWRIRAQIQCLFSLTMGEARPGSMVVVFWPGLERQCFGTACAI